MEFDVKSPWGDGAVCLVLYSEHADKRGSFSEGFRARAFADLGLPDLFMQDCWSRSARNVLRGLHFQSAPLMGKLIRVTKGQALLVARNVHPNSPHFGTAYGVELTEEDLVWVWAPGWYARGYLALAEGTEVHYKCTAEYDSRTERAIRWSDPSMNIDWPVVQPIVSDRDRNAPTLDEALREGLLDFPPVEL